MENKSTYNIVMLGQAEAGKTVFLSSMFYKLSRASSDVDFTISLPFGKRQQLIGRFNSLRSKGEWPKPNEPDKIWEWQFDCSVKINSDGVIESYTPLQFNYIDYAGGLIVDSQSQYIEGQQALSERIIQADALLCLVDGALIFQSLKSGSGEPSHDLENMMDFLTAEVEDSDAPAHFVISKWDLLQNAGQGLSNDDLLSKVRDHLEEISSFQSLVSSRISLGIPMRIIPISSVGTRFASINDSGEISIRYGEKPEPYFVEMPLACVIFDYWTLEAEKVRRKLEKEKASLETTVVVQANTSWWQNLQAMIGSQLSQVAQSLSQDSRFEQSILDSLASYLQSSRAKSEEEAQKRAALLNEQRQEKLMRVTDNKSALDAIIASMQSSVIQLEQQYSESKIV